MVTSRHARRLHHISAYAVAAALLLSGCSAGAAKPAPAPLASASSPSAPVAPTADPAPSLPAEARGGSNAAAVAFVKHYIDVMNHSARTLSTDQLMALSSPTCHSCSALGEHLGEIRAEGGTVSGGEWKASELLPLHADDPATIQVQVMVTFSEQVVTWQDGRGPTRYDAGRTIYFFEVGRRGGNWSTQSIWSDA